jgi:membrane-bound serine protease (ClpP class)
MNLLDPLSWAIVLMTLGCALLVLEVFIPSGGLLSFLAAVALFGSIAVAFRRDATSGLAFMAVALFLVPTVIGLAFKVWPHTPMGKAFLGELPTDDQTRANDPRRELVGKRGIARSKMLPSGSVLVEGKLLDAVSQGMAIEEGQPIIIQEVRGNRVMVRLADPEETDHQAPSASDQLLKPIEDFGLEAFDEPLRPDRSQADERGTGSV